MLAPGMVQKARTGWFDGHYDTPHHGLRLNLVAASRRTGLSCRRLRQYIARCILLPEGKLLSRRMRPPHLKTKREHTILAADLDRLMEAVNAATERGELAHQWKSAGEIFEHYGVDGIYERIQLNKLLVNLHGAGLLSALEVTRRYTAGNGQIRKVTVYDLPEFERLLNGRNPVGITREQIQPPTIQPSPPAGMESVTPPTSPERGRGRPPSEDTQALYKFCYDRYVTDRVAAGELMAEVNIRFAPRFISEEKNVREYARRYANKHGLPWRA